MADVFISYSRRDQEFVRELVARLDERGTESWVDWDDIPPTAAFLQEIYEGIEASNAFLFVISPDSARSEVCRKEIEHAAESHKRIVPLLRRDPDGTPLPEAVASLNWIPVPESADLDGAVDHLVDVLGQDLDHVRRHTRSLTKALEWNRADEDASLLLRGSELRAAEEWIEAGAEKEPAPTQLHYRYLQASRAAAARRQRLTVGAFAVGIVVALALAVVALIQRSHAVEASRVAESRLLASEARSQLSQHQLDTGALLALAAYRVSHTPDARFSLSVAVRDSERLGALLDTGGSTPTAVAVAPTEPLLAAGLENGLVLVYSGPHRRLVARLHAGPGPVTTVSFSRDGRRLLAGTDSGSLALWQRRSGSTRFEPLTIAARANAVAFGSDGRSLVLGTDHGLEWRRLPDGKILHTLRSGHAVKELAVAPDGKVAFGGAYGAHVVAPGGKLQSVPGAMDAPIYGLAFDPAGQRLALIVSQTGLLWTVGDSASQMIGGKTSVIAFGPAGHLVTGGHGGDVVVRDGPGVGAKLGRLGTNTVEGVDAGDGLVAAASQDGLALWNTRSQLQRAVPAHGKDILDDLVVLGRDKVAIAAEDVAGETRVGIKDLASGAWHPLEQPPAGGLVNLAASPDGGVVAAGGPNSQRVTVWSGRGYERQRIRDPKNKKDDEPLDLALAPDGKTLVEATGHNHLIVWALGTAQRPSVIHTSGESDRVALPPSGTAVAVGGPNGKVVRLRLGSTSAEPVGSLGDPVEALAFSPDGRRIAAAGQSGNVAIWRLGSRRPLTLTVGSDRDSVGAIDFDPRGLTFAAGAGQTGQLTLWDTRTGFSLSPTLNLGQEIVSVQFDPTGRMLLAGLAGGHVVQLGRALWDPTAAIDFLCARLSGRLPAPERAHYHVPGRAPSDVCR